MKQETIEQEVAALWMRYAVIENMTRAYSEYFENEACTIAGLIIPADLYETTGQVPRKNNEGMKSGNEGTLL